MSDKFSFRPPELPTFDFGGGLRAIVRDAVSEGISASRTEIKEQVKDNGNLSIGQAIVALKAGLRVARAGWNGKGMQLELQVPDAHSKMTLPYVFMFTAQGDRVPWLCSQTDLLASDWEVVS